jgi:hypothetical protein
MTLQRQLRSHESRRYEVVRVVLDFLSDGVLCRAKRRWV